VFSAANGNRADVPNWVMTVIEASSVNPTAAALVASQIQQLSNTTMFSIGVSNAVSRAELVTLASSPSYVFSFNYSDLVNGFAEQFVCTNLVNTGM
jgi:von Willebrand factor type A domain